MYIPSPKPGFLNSQSAIEELELLITQPSAKQERPCPECRLPCEYLAPFQCAANCDPACENAPRALSAEPDNHPIEAEVVAIVFELTSLRLLQPCWSCEGHLNGQGELWKLPQIGFYSTSVLYPKLVGNYLNRLKFQKQITHPWHIKIVDYGQTWGPTYQIEPAMNEITGTADLNVLQRDLHQIGVNMAENIKQEARLMLANMQQQTQTAGLHSVG